MALFGFGKAALLDIGVACATCIMVSLGVKVSVRVVARCRTRLVGSFVVLRIRFQGLRRRARGVTNRPEGSGNALQGHDHQHQAGK